MATIKFAVHGNATTAYLNSGAGKTPLVIDNSGGGAPAVVVDATAIGGFAINYNGGGVTKGHIFPGFTNSQQTGLISVLSRVAPSYSGSPAGNSSIISVGGPRLLNSNSVQLLQIDHLTTGNLVITLTDIAGGGIASQVLGAWSPVANTYYDIVVTWDGTTASNAVKTYIDGVLFNQFTINKVWTSANNSQSTILIGAGQNQVQQGLYKLNEYVLWDFVINPTSGGLNLNGAARTTFVSTAGLNLDPNNSTNPGIDNVATGVAYIIGGVSFTGNSDEPAESDVRSGVQYDNNTKTGTLLSTDPGQGNVLLATAYTINSVAKTGTLTSTDPGQANVFAGVAYTINSVAKTGTLAPAVNTLTQAMVIGQAPPSAEAIVLYITQGDTVVFNLKALNGPDGDAFDLSFATFSTTLKGNSGDVTFGNSQHTANPDQTGHKGEYTLSLSATDSNTVKLGAKKEIVTQVTQGASVIYFHGMQSFTVIKKTPVA